MEKYDKFLTGENRSLFGCLKRTISIDSDEDQDIEEMYGSETLAKKYEYCEYSVDKMKELYEFTAALDAASIADTDFIYKKMINFYSEDCDESEIISKFMTDRIKALEFLKSEIEFRTKHNLVTESYTYYNPIVEDAVKKFFFNQEDHWEKKNDMHFYNYYKEYNDRVYNRKRGLLGSLFN